MSQAVAPVAPPTPQEVHRKLSVRAVSRPKPSNISIGPVSGTESDSDSVLTSDIGTPTASYGLHFGTSPPQPPLTAIAERRSNSGEDTDDEDAGEGVWKSAAVQNALRSPIDESVLKAGYLWKKGERRKNWKKRWFVLRPAHLAYYKSSKEYQLLRLLELSDIHSCTQVHLKRHENAFGLICASRTFYLQALTPQDVQEWVKVIEEARQSLLAISTPTSEVVPTAVPSSIAASRTLSRGSITLSSSPPQASSAYAHHHVFTSSDSEDALTPQPERLPDLSPVKPSTSQHDPAKVILSGYLMKCGAKRRTWRKRWFVLSAEKLVYSRSHMDTKHHRQFAFNEILDVLEFDMHAHKQSSAALSAVTHGAADGEDLKPAAHTFKIVMTKRSLLLCAPSADDESKWLGAIRALIEKRTESGQVPGKIPKARVPFHDDEPKQGTSSGGSGGLRNKVRRMSAAGTHGDEAKHEGKS